MDTMGRTGPQATWGAFDQQATFPRSTDKYPDSKTDEKQQISGMKRIAEITRHIDAAVRPTHTQTGAKSQAALIHDTRDTV